MVECCHDATQSTTLDALERKENMYLNISCCWSLPHAGMHLAIYQSHAIVACMMDEY